MGAVTWLAVSSTPAGAQVRAGAFTGDVSEQAGRAVWFDTSAFTTAPAFTIGTSSRNPVRGPVYRNLDVAVIRRVSLPASKALEIRAEAFNLTNTTPFGAPNGVFGSAVFGTITSAGDPRVIQLALKFVF